MTNALLSSVRQKYWQVARMLTPGSTGTYPVDFTPEESATMDTVRPFTMTTPERVVSLIRAVQHIAMHRIAGDFVECGVWKGGSMMAAALTLVRVGDTARDLYLYDTYDGMPPPTDADRDFQGHAAADQLASQSKDAMVWARAQFDEVRANMTSTGYPAERIVYVQGKVEDTIPGQVPERIALLRLDTDWYESTRHEMEHLFPRLVPGGVLILDDYGHWEGARKAVDEYLARCEKPLLLARVDAAGRIAVKHW